jgi:hypothetical protein
VTAVFYALTVLAALLSCLGLWTRVATVALLIGVTSLHHRAPDILHSGDTLMRVMLLYIALAPSGAAFSLDRLIGLRKGTAPPLPPEVSMWPQRMMQVQVAIVYLTTVWHKSPMIAITTYGTLLVELALGTLVFAKPLRKWVLLAGVLLHAGIEWRMNIPLFAFTAVATYITFYEGEETAAWLKRAAARLRLRQTSEASLPRAAKGAPGPQA